MAERHERALEIARQAGADAVLAAHPGTVAWLTGYGGEVEWGPNPFALPPFAVVASGEPAILVVSEDEAPAAEELGCRVESYPGFTVEPLRPVAGAAEALKRAAGGRTVATEAGYLPAALAEGISWTDAGDELAGARAVKDPDEIELLRRAIAVCDAGQRAAREQARAGMTELDLWALVKGAMEREAGRRLAALADLVSGPRTAEIGGPPSTRTIAEGELVLCDLVPRWQGYWGDSCSTFAVGGEASKDATEMWRRSREALEGLIGAVRPGVRAGDLDAMFRDSLAYPHHTGHGVGTLMHEEPRIVPGWETALAPGMVIAFEPGTYGASEGVRVEWLVLVTADGCEVLSKHDLELV